VLRSAGYKSEVFGVHPESLAHQKLPPELVSKQIWEQRFEGVCDFEQYLTPNGVVVRKFFLQYRKRNRNGDSWSVSTIR
jgi:polyphosphate kinase 2 (PPK2 family)